MALTKTDLIDQCHANTPEMKEVQALEAVETILSIIKVSPENEDGFLLSGSGKFNVKFKPARMGRNPQTGESLALKARRVVTFKPSGTLRKKLKGK